MREPTGRTARRPARTPAAYSVRRDLRQRRSLTARPACSRTDLDRDLAARVTGCQVDEGFRDSVEVVSPLDHRLHLSRRNKAAQQDEVVLFQAGDEHGHDVPASTDRSQTDIEKCPIARHPPPLPCWTPAAPTPT